MVSDKTIEHSILPCFARMADGISQALVMGKTGSVQVFATLVCCVIGKIALTLFLAVSRAARALHSASAGPGLLSSANLAAIVSK
jgi:hypothetical protein